MKIIDYKTESAQFYDPSAGVLDQVFITDAWVRILDMGYKPWLETAIGEARCDGLIPIVDTRENTNWRGVHGYISFGHSGGVVSPDVSGWGDNENTTLWHKADFLNWRENYFRAPTIKTIRNHREFSVPHCNSVRIWLRPDVRAYCHFNLCIAKVEWGAVRITDPNTGAVVGGWHGPVPPLGPDPQP